MESNVKKVYLRILELPGVGAQARLPPLYPPLPLYFTLPHGASRAKRQRRRSPLSNASQVRLFATLFATTATTTATATLSGQK